MDPARYAAHIASLKGKLPDEVLTYAARLGSSDEQRAEIAEILTAQFQKAAAFQALDAEAQEKIAEITQKLSKSKKGGR